MMDSTVRLYCFAHAGASAQAFHGWQQHFPERVQVRAVERPGHGRRLREPLVHDFATLVDGLAAELADEIVQARQREPGLQYAAFGHSAGAAFAFATCARVAERIGQAPLHCVLSAGAAPHVTKKQRSTMSEAALIDEVKSLSGTPPMLLEDAELRAIFMPMLRADFAAYEGCGQDSARRLDCPLSLFAASVDIVARDDVWAWRHYGTRGATQHVLPGDHFSVLQSPLPLIERIRTEMGL